MWPPAAGTRGETEMDCSVVRRAATAAAALLLGACGMDASYYVKTDNSPDVLTGVAHMMPPPHPPAPLDLGVTFKSGGKILLGATDLLYRSVHDDLSSRGRWAVHRLGSMGEDFAPVIQSIVTARAGTLQNQPAQARMLVLVENAPDLSAGTRTNYFVSGMTFGAYSLHKPTDRYDVTIAYRDPQGVERIYRSHQELYLAIGSRVFGYDTQGLAGLKAYDSPVAAFNGIVDNSVNGARRGTVTPGTPHFEVPQPATP